MPDAVDICIRQINQALPHCWQPIRIERCDFNPPRDAEGHPLNFSSQEQMDNREKMDRLVVQVDGPTKFDAEILPSAPPYNWTGQLRIISNAALTERYPEDVHLPWKPGQIIDFNTLRNHLIEFAHACNDRIGIVRPQLFQTAPGTGVSSTAQALGAGRGKSIDPQAMLAKTKRKRARKK